MKPILLRNIAFLADKSRAERNAIVTELFQRDEKLRFYRKIFMMVILAAPVTLTGLGHGLTGFERIFAGFSVGICTPVLISIFCVNPRVKELLAGAQPQH